MKARLSLGRQIISGGIGLGLFYLCLGLAAYFFEFYARYRAGIKTSELSFASYASPTPNPNGNFFTSLGFDFENPIDGKYRARSLLDYPLRPKMAGIADRDSPDYIPWPLNPAFSHVADLNASATGIRKLAEQLPENPADRVGTYRRSLLESKNSLEICNQALRPFRLFLDGIYNRVQEPSSIYPCPYPEFPSINTPTLSLFDFLDISRLMTLDLYVRFTEPNKKVSAAPILASFRMSEAIFQRPVGLMSFIGGLASVTNTLPFLWQGLEGGHFVDSEISAILQAFEKVDPLMKSREVIAQENARNYQILHWSALKEPWWKDIFLIPVSKLWQGMFVLQLKEVGVAMEDPAIFKKSPLRDNPSYWNFYNILYPSHAIAIHNEAVFQKIMLALAHLDVALDFFIKKTGSAPANLEALVPSILTTLPKDPFTGLDFGYKKTGPKTYLLYSHWIDQQDDGGKEISIPRPQSRDFRDFLFHEAKGDFVWPPHHAGKN